VDAGHDPLLSRQVVSRTVKGCGERQLAGMPTPFRSLSTEIALVTPLSFDEACSALVLVREQKTLVLDTASLEPEVAQRTVDFLSGGVLAIDGHSERVGEQVFLFAPQVVRVLRDEH
jgi:cell division inhibitor SepF